MMGMVFTELMEMVETKFSFDLADRVLARSGQSGTWTAVGNYDDAELVAVVTALSEETNLPVSDLLYAYGRHLHGRFMVLYPGFFHGHADAFAFLLGLESRIHTEVRKLWPDARPPLFEPVVTAQGMDLRYSSRRGLARLARGLLDASFDFHGPAVVIEEIDLSDGAGTQVMFRVLRAA
jgi:hypothetical protein